MQKASSYCHKLQLGEIEQLCGIFETTKRRNGEAFIFSFSFRFVVVVVATLFFVFVLL